MVNIITISTVAYAVDQSMVFVRVPNERGRWMLTHRCVAEVGCPLCGSIPGEPCRSNTRNGTGFPREPRYITGTHVVRRDALCAATRSRRPATALPRHKIRMRPEDIPK